jgi:hypothetical protein
VAHIALTWAGPPGLWPGFGPGRLAGVELFGSCEAASRLGRIEQWRHGGEPGEVNVHAAWRLALPDRAAQVPARNEQLARADGGPLGRQR